MFAASFAVLVVSLGMGAAPAGGEEPPVSVFAELNGTWQGTFVGYDPEGKELYRIEVEQTYRTVDEHTQEVRIRDTDGKGDVVTGVGTNVARREGGQLILECRVEKSNGDKVFHRGRIARGADGRPQLIWFTRSPGRVETFRERVEGDVYAIDGMGIYGGSPVLMHGVYRRVR